MGLCGRVLNRDKKKRDSFKTEKHLFSMNLTSEEGNPLISGHIQTVWWNSSTHNI